jgi:Flp pilus assembly protein TadD
MDGRDPTRDTLTSAALVALALLVFAPVTQFEFLNFDDDLYVTANAHVRAGLTWDTVRWAFSSAETGHFHPLTWLSHALDVTWFGLDAGAHHRTSLLLHAVATALCFLAWRRLRLRFEVAALAGALFAVHPLRLESVAWVSTRKDVLSAVFFFLALLAWAWWLERPGRGRLTLTAGVFLIALLCKPTVLPLPLLLLALDRWPLDRQEPFVARVLEKWPLFALSAAFALVAVVGQRSAGTMPTVEAIGLLDRLANASVALVTNVGRLLWPVEVSLFHPLRPLPPGLGLACGVVLAGVSAWAARSRSSAAFAWWWFLALLLPVSGLVQIGGQLIADRWLYLPLSGVVVGLASLWRWPSRSLAIVGALLVIACAGLTRRSLPFYASSEVAFRHALDVEPDNFLAHTNLGFALEARGALDEAHQHFEAAARLNPTWPTAQNNLGNVLARRGQLREAEEAFRTALRRQPDLAQAQANLALALSLQGRPQEALPHFQEAVRLRPNDANATLGYGAALVTTGQLVEGLRMLEQSTQLEPSVAEAWAHLSRAYRLSGRAADAERALQQALRLDPAQPLALQERTGK